MPLNSQHLFGPGSAPGQTPTDFEQSTGRERYELSASRTGVEELTVQCTAWLASTRGTSASSTSRSPARLVRLPASFVR